MIDNMKKILAVAILATGLITSLHSYAQEAGQSTLNLDNVDIRVLINTVAKATGRNFIVDPRVKAKVTVVSSKAMDSNELYEIFLSILQVHGYSAVPGVGFIKIVPDTNAKQGAIPISSNSLGGPRDELVTRVIQINNAPANQLVPILRPLVPQQGHLAAYVPTNVLVVTDRAANIDRLVQVIRRMDKGDNQEIDIVPLENASADDVVRLLTSLKQKGAKDASSSNTKIIADQRSNSILVAGDKATRERLSGLIKKLDKPLESTGNTQVIFLRYADAKEMSTLLTGVAKKAAQAGGAKKSGSASSSNDVDIIADESNNALVITAPSAVAKTLQGIIKQLDIKRAQVMIEAIIADVSTNLTNQLSVSVLANNDGTGTNPIGGSIFPGVTALLAAINDSTGATALPNGLSLVAGDDGRNSEFGALVNALNSDGASNVLSTPSIVTLDNKEAEIIFGQNIPIITGSTASNNNANPFQTIERQDVGITLKVKPQINDGNVIKLELSQESSSVSSDSTAGIITNKRSITTEVSIEDGQILVLGGLTEETYSETESKVPLLGSIPLLGTFFKSESNEKRTTNLMLFIRPIILYDREKADFFTNQKYRTIREKQAKSKATRSGLFGVNATPFPEIEAVLAETQEQNANRMKAEKQNKKKKKR